jgi:hypothetical protein
LNRLPFLPPSSSFALVNVAATKSSRKQRGARIARKEAAAPRFWIRCASPELDRTGDFILKNLPSIRQEAASRAGAA